MKFSLGKKTILLILCINTVISLLTVGIYARGIRGAIESQYKQRSIEITKLVALEIDPQRLSNVQTAIRTIYEQSDNKVYSDQWGTPAFEAYVAQFEPVKETDDYRALYADLRRMQDVLDVDCLYLSWIDVPNECYVYLIDAAEDDPCPPGCIDPIYLDNAAEQLKDLTSLCEPNITNTPEYGWLITTGMPIYDSQGEVIAFVAVDISMNDVISQQNRYLFYVVLAFLAMIVIFCVIGIIMANRFIITPINMLSRAAAEYKHNKKVFSALHISRKDEIGALADSMVQMEEEIDGYIASLEQTTDDLVSAREHAEQMDRAANIDALTKVRNKRAYDTESKRLNESAQPYGILMIDLNELKEINDKYGHEKGNISINTLCKTVCRVFKHSPVYRVGGDEFIVILENSDYAERDALIASITEIFRENMQNEDRKPWERVTAAVGYADHDPAAQESVDQVLRRADAAMYANKKAMKAE